jgi:hypothetical protein
VTYPSLHVTGCDVGVVRSGAEAETNEEGDVPGVVRHGDPDLPDAVGGGRSAYHGLRAYLRSIDNAVKSTYVSSG